jgi:hypothetical protein
VRLACAAVAAVAAGSWLGTEGQMHPLKNARVCARKALRAGAHTPATWHQGARADCVMPKKQKKKTNHSSILLPALPP